METSQRTIMDLTRNTSKWDRRVNAAVGRLRTSDKAVEVDGARPGPLLPPDLAPEDTAAAEALLRAASTTHPFEATLLVRRIRSNETAYFRLWIRSDDEGVQSDLIYDTALTDPLTALPGRGVLSEEIRYAIEKSAPDQRVAVILLGIDRFRTVNEGRGFHGGDELLQWIAWTLQRRVRDTDFVGRLGGDEFVVIATGLRGEDDAYAFADSLRACTTTREAMGGPANGITLSAGVAVGDITRSPDELLLEADKALAVAKRDGRDRTQVYDTRLGQITQQQINADERLRRALEAGAIDNNYQPILDTATGSIVAMETLIRLADDHELPLRPFEILRAAKDSGLLGQVDMHVLTQACATIAQWTTFAPELVMTLNLHTKQFRDPKLTMAVANATKRVGLSTENLGFEVDQSILADMNEAFEITQRLQGMGVKIYIEAFQGSAGAIKKVKELQPDGVKLDRLLVAALDEPWGRALVEPIVRTLVDDDIEVTAVGVATHAQLDQLRDMGCHRVQGYLFAPPLPAALAHAILLDNRRKPVPTSLL